MAAPSVLVPGGKGNALVWFRGLDSNQDNQIQSLVAYRLADPGIGR
jgi:hypothetical protein